MSIILPYSAKKAIAGLLMPSSLVVEVFVLGWVLSRFTRFKRAGKAFEVMAGGLLLAFACGLGGDYLFRIERRYPPFEPHSQMCESLRGCDILVLGQGLEACSDLPLRFRVNSVFIQRLLEGVRVSRWIPESRIVVSMAGSASVEEKARFLREYAESVGLPENRFVMVVGARDTADEARLMMKVVRTNRLVIATSAAHLPRAMGIFKKQNALPVAAPCDYFWAAPKAKGVSLRRLPIPCVGGFDISRRAMYEWLGSLYESLSPAPPGVVTNMTRCVPQGASSAGKTGG